MAWFGDLMHTRTKTWYFSPLDHVPGADNPPPRVVEPQQWYIGVVLRSLRVPYARKGASRFYGAVTSRCSLPYRGGDPAEFFVLTTPPGLKGVDPSQADRVLTLNKRLLGPVPYRGGDLDVELGLLSVKSSDLAEPYLDLLEEIASIAGVSLLGPAATLVHPLRRGLDVLARGDPSVLEVGLSTTFASPETGLYCLVAADAAVFDHAALTLDAGSQLIVRGSGPVTEYAYLVFSVEAYAVRHDWWQIPEVGQAHEELMREVHNDDFNGVREALANFRRIVITSPDLLAAHAQEVYDEVRDDVDRAMGPRAQSRTSRPGIRPLREIELHPVDAVQEPPA